MPPSPVAPSGRCGPVRSRAAVAFGVTVAATASSYVSSFPSVASRHELAVSTGRDSGLAVLLGPVTSLDTVGGYTVYKLFVFLTTIAALWSLLAATRLLRGEEDAGRWQLVLAGNTRAAHATAATLVGLGAAIGVVAATVSIFTWLAGRDGDIGFGVGDSLVYAGSIAVPAVVFAAVGAVTAQLGKTRRVAAGIGVAVLAVSFVLRMIADSGSGTRWIAWTTPFGWSENVHPFTRNDLVPFVPAALTVVALGVLAIVLAAHRDAGDGIVSSRDDVAPRAFGLRSPAGLAARLELPMLGAWCGGVFAAGLAFGIVAKAATSASSSLRDTLDKFDVAGPSPRSTAGWRSSSWRPSSPSFPPRSSVPQATKSRVVAWSTSSWRPSAAPHGWPDACCSAQVLSSSAALLAGSGFWIGAAAQGVHLGLLDMLGAGANVIPTALLALGLGRGGLRRGAPVRVGIGVRHRRLLHRDPARRVDGREPERARALVAVPLHVARPGAGSRSRRRRRDPRGGGCARDRGHAALRAPRRRHRMTQPCTTGGRPDESSRKCERAPAWRHRVGARGHERRDRPRRHEDRSGLWALHGQVAYDGEVIAAVFASEHEAWFALSRSTSARHR